MDRFHRWLKKTMNYSFSFAILHCEKSFECRWGFYEEFFSLSVCVYVACAIVGGWGRERLCREKSVSCMSTVCTLDDKEIKYVGRVVGLSIQWMAESILIPIYFWVVACQNRFPIPKSICWFDFFLRIVLHSLWFEMKRVQIFWWTLRSPWNSNVTKRKRKFSSRKMCQTCSDTIRWHLSNRFGMDRIIFIRLLWLY